MRPREIDHPIGPPGSDATPAVLTLLQGYLANATLPPDGRLPPERALAASLGVGRGELRKALAVLERQGALWRHVGKGTFLGERPVAAIGDLASLAHSTSPPAVMAARLALEPQIAERAALNASADQVFEITARAARPTQRLSWRQFESADAQFHRSIAAASQNTVLLHLFDTLAAIRRAVTWGRRRTTPEGPPHDHHSFAEHEAIARAIAERDGKAAAEAMRLHLAAVARGLDG